MGRLGRKSHMFFSVVAIICSKVVSFSSVATLPRKVMTPRSASSDDNEIIIPGLRRPERRDEPLARNLVSTESQVLLSRLQPNNQHPRNIFVVVVG